MSWNKGLDLSDERVRKYVRCGQEHSQWKGGFSTSGGGYLAISKHNVEEEFRCMASTDGYILYHRYVMAKHLGRALKRDEIVHHIDGDKYNNDISNLELTDRASHVGEHHSDHIEKASDTLEKLKLAELEELTRNGMVTANKAAEILGVRHSTIRRRQLKGDISNIKTKYNGHCLTLDDVEKLRNMIQWHKSGPRQ